MFNKVILPNMKFISPQAINPHIGSNKEVKVFAEVLPKNLGKKHHISARKLLDKKIEISLQPQKDEVVLTKTPVAQDVKKSKTCTYSNEKTIKNVLANFFDNSKQVEIADRQKFQKDKATNLNNLVKEFEQENQKNNPFTQRAEAKKLMMQDAITRLAEY